MPPERTRKSRTEELWEREVGGLPPKRFANSVMASKEFVQSLNIQKRLRKHRSCVNTISFSADGRLLLSGSDDRTLVLWDWEEAAPALSFHTGFSSNVYHALFMPVSGDRSIVSCAAEGDVIHSQIQEGGRVVTHTHKLVELGFAVHRLAVEPASPHTFYCCCQDSSVWLFDLRARNAMELFKCRSANYHTAENIALYAISLDPRKPCCFAVAGSDQYVRIYDTRKIFVDGNSSFSRPTEHFCPPHLIGRVEEEITGLAYSQTSELLASYGQEDIYLFSREHGLHFNNVEVNKRLLEDMIEPSFNDKLPVPKKFKGHRNEETVKGVDFLGPNCDFVTSGSDCGSIFIWRKKDAELIRAMRGDKRVVNCVEQHPSGIVLASSGIENDIKIWEPGEGENRSIVQADEDDDNTVWIHGSSDSDDFFDDNGFGLMVMEPIHLYENSDNDSYEEDTSSEEHDSDGDSSAGDEDSDGGNSAGDEGDD